MTRRAAARCKTPKRAPWGARRLASTGPGVDALRGGHGTGALHSRGDATADRDDCGDDGTTHEPVDSVLGDPIDRVAGASVARDCERVTR